MFILTLMLFFSSLCSCNMFIQHGHAACFAAYSCSMETQPWQEAWACSMAMLYRHAAWIRKMDLQHGYAWTHWMDMQQGHATCTVNSAWTCSVHGQQGNARRACSMDTQHIRVACLCSIDMQHWHAAWSCSTPLYKEGNCAIRAGSGGGGVWCFQPHYLTKITPFFY